LRIYLLARAEFVPVDAHRGITFSGGTVTFFSMRFLPAKRVPEERIGRNACPAPADARVVRVFGEQGTERNRRAISRSLLIRARPPVARKSDRVVYTSAALHGTFFIIPFPTHARQRSFRFSAERQIRQKVQFVADFSFGNLAPGFYRMIE
jgi:hypothetical protein